jgi:hypothetical protein
MWMSVRAQKSPIAFVTERTFGHFDLDAGGESATDLALTDK